jgi:NAD(P)-dependent dehydrogenase (short-subunit alcohol dehydrogenase family)
LINGAGTFTSTEFLDVSMEQWKHTLDLQLTAPFLFSQLAARDWVASGIGGSIVNVASTAAVRAKETRGSVDYSASKAGLLGLTTYLAVQFGRYGIRTNAVLPHSFTSPMNVARLADPDEAERAKAGVPLNRIASAGDVAATIAFLALDGEYLNGVLLPCDGGVSVKMS